MAKLYFRYGAMNCGKSLQLLSVAYNYNERGMNVLVIKPSVDTKGDNKIVARVGVEREVDYLIAPTDSVIDTIKDKLDNISCLLTDESQFFTESQVEELFKIAKLYNIPVISYGLKTDFRSYTFPGSKRLLELADELNELATICRCGKKARFNARMIDGKFVKDGDQVAIDGVHNITYESLCGKCYLKKVQKESK